MSNTNETIQQCGMLNRVFAHFFIKESEILGVNFSDSMPQMDNIACLNKDGHYFVEGDFPYGLKEFFHGQVNLKNIDIDKFKHESFLEFFNQEMKKELLELAKDFSSTVEKHKYCDFVFSSLPECSPYIFDCIYDTDTNFRSRFILAHDISSNSYHGIFEFYCLIMIRFRRKDDHPVYGESYQDVDLMNDEEREKINKHPEKECLFKADIN